eukprot:1154013-Pelagomonas_calceolata.AAC.3
MPVFLHAPRKDSLAGYIQDASRPYGGYRYKTLGVKNEPGLSLGPGWSYGPPWGNKYADAMAKHQAIQDDDTPADTTFRGSSPLSILKVILSMTPPGLPLRKLSAPMQAHQNAPTCPKV